MLRRCSGRRELMSSTALHVFRVRSLHDALLRVWQPIARRRAWRRAVAHSSTGWLRGSERLLPSLQGLLARGRDDSALDRMALSQTAAEVSSSKSGSLAQSSQPSSYKSEASGAVPELLPRLHC